MFKYLVFNCENESDKYIIKSDLKENIRSKIKSVFNFETFKCEYFDEEFNEYCTILDDEFPDKGRLRITNLDVTIVAQKRLVFYFYNITQFSQNY